MPTGIWNKPGELSAHERHLAESHSYHTDSVLKMSSTFAALAGTAAAAHERADGSGYYRAHHAIDPPSALLGTADVYDALVSHRPWRPAFSPDDAIAEIQRMSADGALHAESAAAVLSVARGGRTVEIKHPDRLTHREVEVLKLLVTGVPTKTIAARLSISAKTADKHIQSGVAIRRGESMVFSLRENTKLTTASGSYSWVNPLQIWSIGSVDLSTGEVAVKGYLPE